MAVFAGYQTLPGAPNYNFFLNTLKTLFRLPRYLIYISRNAFQEVLQKLYLFGHPGELESFRNYKEEFNVLLKKEFFSFL